MGPATGHSGHGGPRSRPAASPGSDPVGPCLHPLKRDRPSGPEHAVPPPYPAPPLQLSCYDQAKQLVLSTGYLSDGIFTHFVASFIAVSAGCGVGRGLRAGAPGAGGASCIGGPPSDRRSPLAPRLERVPAPSCGPRGASWGPGAGLCAWRGPRASCVAGPPETRLPRPGRMCHGPVPAPGRAEDPPDELQGRVPGEWGPRPAAARLCGRAARVLPPGGGAGLGPGPA